jgi:WD40 repeat protein
MQPLRLDIKVKLIGMCPNLTTQKKLTARSDRVKCVDIHPDEPWMLASLYNGSVHLWNYSNQVWAGFSIPML